MELAAIPRELVRDMALLDNQCVGDTETETSALGRRREQQVRLLHAGRRSRPTGIHEATRIFKRDIVGFEGHCPIIRELEGWIPTDTAIHVIIKNLKIDQGSL